MQLTISHSTRYVYDHPVQLLPHLLYLRPRANPLLHVGRFEFTLRPAARIDWMRDDFDNIPASVQFQALSSELLIRTDCDVTTDDAPPFDFLVRDYALTFPFAYEPLHRFNLGLYLSPPDAEAQVAIRAWLDAHFTDRPDASVQWLVALNNAVYRGLHYRRRDEPGIQSATETIALGTGSCRDYAMLLVACARTLGVAARFVSGYLYDPAFSDSARGGDMHAWAEVFLPGAGWRGLDPTHGIFCDNAYIPVAHAVVAESVNPVQGAYHSLSPVEASLDIDVRIRRTG